MGLALPIAQVVKLSQSHEKMSKKKKISLRAVTEKTGLMTVAISLFIFGADQYMKGNVAIGAGAVAIGIVILAVYEYLELR